MLGTEYILDITTFPKSHVSKLTLNKVDLVPDLYWGSKPKRQLVVVAEKCVSKDRRVGRIARMWAELTILSPLEHLARILP